MTYETIGTSSLTDMNDGERAAIRHLLHHCGALKAGERVVVVCNPTTSDLGTMACVMAQNDGALARLFEIQPATVHGQELPSEAATAMKGADLILGLTTVSLAHTAARKAASSAGVACTR